MWDVVGWSGVRWDRMRWDVVWCDNMIIPRVKSIAGKELGRMNTCGLGNISDVNPCNCFT